MRRIAWLMAVVLLLASCRAIEDKPLPPPFQLTADEQKGVDRLLARWEQWNADLKTFECRFKRWTYNTVFGRPGQPLYVDVGEIKYGAPDRGLFHVQQTEKDGKLEIWLEALPRSTRTAADMARMQLIFHAKDMSPSAMQIVGPNGKDRVTYGFFRAAANGMSPEVEKAAFEPTTPLGWQKG